MALGRTDEAQTMMMDRITPAPVPSGRNCDGAFTLKQHVALFDRFQTLRRTETGGAAPERGRTDGKARLVFWNVERLRHLDDTATSLADLWPDVMLLSLRDRGMARSGNLDRVADWPTDWGRATCTRSRSSNLTLR